MRRAILVGLTLAAGCAAPPPPWDEQLVEREARHLSKRLTPLLELGRFHGYLPQELAQATVVQKLDIGRFGELYRNGRLFPVNPQHSDLRSLL